MLHRIKDNHWSIILTLALALSLLFALEASAYQVNSQTEKEEILTAGAKLKTYRLNTSDGIINAYVMALDLSNQYLKVDTIVGSDGTLGRTQSVTDMAGRTGAVAAINGGFFQMNVGKPIGVLISDGQLISSPSMRDDMPGLGITADNQAYLGIFGFDGSVRAENGADYPLFGINKPHYLIQTGASADDNNLVLYDRKWGATCRGGTGAVEVVVVNKVVQAIHNNGQPAPIPSNGYVLRGTGDAAQYLQNNLAVGSTLQVDYGVSPNNGNFLAATAGNTLLVENGGIAQFTQTVGNKVARTAAGLSRDGQQLYLVVIEGGSSRGMNQTELARFMIDYLGVDKAVNLDGGGSTTLAARPLGESKAQLINQPQQSSQRRVTDSLAIFSTAPAGNIEGMLISAPPVLLAGTEGTLSAKGYDQYYNPYPVTLNDIEWQVEPAIGTVANGVFKTSSGGTATLTANYHGASESVAVRVIGADDIQTLALSPANITLEPGQSVKLSAEITTKDGQTYPLDDGLVNWQVPSEAGRVDNGVFTAGSQFASDKIRVDYQGVQATIPVTVKGSNSQIVPLAPDKMVDIMPESGLELRFPARSVSEPAEVHVTHGVPGLSLPERYQAVKSLQVQPMGSGLQLQRPYTLSYRLEQGASGLVVLKQETGSQSWQSQPYTLDDGKISANIEGFATVVIAFDKQGASKFKDTANLWPGAEEIINDMASRGIIQGFLDNTFRPGQDVTRAEFVTMMGRAFNWQKPANPPVFTDQQPDWGQDAIATAVTKKIVSGYTDGTFRPHQSITRAEMAAMMVRALNLPAEDVELTYKDAAAVPAIFQNYVAQATKAGLLQGQDGLFRPQDSANRAETAVVIARMLNIN